MAQFIDVLPLINKATSEMALGQVVLAESYTLYDTMAAIQIMDPRIDLGMEDATSPSKAQAQFDPYKVLLPIEVLDIMDQLLACEMTWHAATSLSQTVFPCLYVHALQQIDGAQTQQTLPPLTTLVLRSYIRGVLKTCDVIMEEFLQCRVQSSEDYSHDKADISLCEDTEVDDIIRELDEAYGWLAAQDNISCAPQLLSRLRHRMAFLCIITNLFVPSTDFNLLRSQLDGLTTILQEIAQEPSRTLDVAIISACFDSTICRKLATANPPRPVQPISQEEAWSALRKFVSEIQEIVELEAVNDFKGIQAIFVDVARSDPPWSSPARSFLQAVLVKDSLLQGRSPIRQLALSFYESYGIPWMAMFDRYDAVELHKFMETLAARLIDYLNALAQNRARQNRKLARQLYGFHQLTSEISRTIPEDVHQQLCSPLLHLQSTILIESLLGGIELSLFSVLDLPSVYWYMERAAQVGINCLLRVPSPDAFIHKSRKAWLQAMNDAARYRFRQSLMQIKASDLTSRARQLVFERRFKWAPMDSELTPDFAAFCNEVDEARALDHNQIEDGTPTWITEAENGNSSELRQLLGGNDAGSMRMVLKLVALDR